MKERDTLTNSMGTKRNGVGWNVKPEVRISVVSMVLQTKKRRYWRGAIRAQSLEAFDRSKHPMQQSLDRSIMFKAV